MERTGLFTVPLSQSLSLGTLPNTPSPPLLSTFILLILITLVRSRQDVGRNRQADLLGGFEIDHQLELRRLLDGKVGGLGAFQDFVDVSCGA